MPSMFSPQSRTELKSAVDACKPEVCQDESCYPIGWWSDDVACSFADTSVALQTGSSQASGDANSEDEMLGKQFQVVSIRIGELALV